MKKNMVLVLLTMGLLIGTSSQANARGRSRNSRVRFNPPGNSGNAPGHKKNTDAPFDGGLIVLISAGALYSIKRAYDQSKKPIMV